MNGNKTGGNEAYHRATELRTEGRREFVRRGMEDEKTLELSFHAVAKRPLTRVEKTAHNPAKIFKIDRRGFIKAGYYADLAIVNTGMPWRVNKDNILYKCGWSPFEDFTFTSRVTHTFVNGELVFHNFKTKEIHCGKRLEFNR